MNQMTQLYREGMAELREENAKLTARIAELEAAQRWIPVSERLPEEYVNVLGAYRSGVFECRYSSFRQPFDRSCIGWHSPDGYCLHNVTHWMPLPEPPEVKNGKQ